MEPGQFKQANFTFTAPKGMEETCGSLNVFRGKDPEGLPCILSKWMVTDEDLERIKKQRYIWLNITGIGMPPVAVFTEWPFEEVKGEAITGPSDASLSEQPGTGESVPCPDSNPDIECQ